MSRGVSFGAGLMLGALFGVGLVLLFAPQGGAETRQAIQDRVQEILDEGRQAADARRLELTARLEELKQPTREP
jgi:gas vesicle protein